MKAAALMNINESVRQNTAGLQLNTSRHFLPHTGKCEARCMVCLSHPVTNIGCGKDIQQMSISRSCTFPEERQA